MESIPLDNLVSEPPKPPNKPLTVFAIIFLIVILSAAFLYELFPNQFNKLYQATPTPSPKAIPQPFSESPTSLSKLTGTVTQVFAKASSSNPQYLSITHFTKLASASQTLEDEYTNYLKAYKEMVSLYSKTKDPQIKYAIIELKNYLYYSPVYREGDIVIPE